MIRPFKKLCVYVLEILLHVTQYIARVLCLVGDSTIHNVLGCAPMSNKLLNNAQASNMSQQALQLSSKQQHDRTSAIITTKLIIQETNRRKFSCTMATQLA